MKLESAQSKESDDRESELARRRTALANVYDALPAYASAAFWHAIEEPDTRTAVPIDVLVRCARLAVANREPITAPIRIL